MRRLSAESGYRYTIANRGEITTPNKKERRERLGPYLEATTFHIYRDEVSPIVTISQDGTLGWVIAQVYARGDQRTPTGEVVPIEFVSAWIELYEKEEGQWLRIGNVSNFRQ